MASQVEDDARAIFSSVISDLNVEESVRSVLKREGNLLQAGPMSCDLRETEVVLIGIGKASIRMGAAAEDVFGDSLSTGLLVTDRSRKANLRSDVIVAGHPVPNENSLKAGSEILRLVSAAASATDSGSGKMRLIIFLISGGGSALVESPVDQAITLEDIQEMNRVLVGCGATIREMNVIRKHFSAIKGGRLGAVVSGVPVLALYISDVNAGDIFSIASNPLLPDNATLAEFQSVIERYQLLDKLPGSMADMVSAGKIERLPSGVATRSPDISIETGSGAELVENIHSIEGGTAENSSQDTDGPISSQLPEFVQYGNIAAAVLMDNRSAVQAAAAAARSLGYKPIICDDLEEGQYKELAAAMVARLEEARMLEVGPVCIVSGGEAVCPVHKPGIGGRNQEFVLYSAAHLLTHASDPETCILSCGTDGIDGNSSAAGAVASAELIVKSGNAGLNLEPFLERNDSNSFFRKAGGLIVTGPTGNNVRDIRILLSRGR